MVIKRLMTNCLNLSIRFLTSTVLPEKGRFRCFFMQFTPKQVDCLQGKDRRWSPNVKTSLTHVQKTAGNSTRHIPHTPRKVKFESRSAGGFGREIVHLWYKVKRQGKYYLYKNLYSCVLKWIQTGLTSFCLQKSGPWRRLDTLIRIYCAVKSWKSLVVWRGKVLGLLRMAKGQHEATLSGKKQTEVRKKWWTELCRFEL